MSEGDAPDNLLAIQDGFIKVTSLDDEGNERLLWIAGRHDIVPTEHLFSLDTPLDFFYTALSDGTAHDINKVRLLDYAKTNSSFMAEIAAMMSSHYDDLLQRINSIEQASVRDKLIATLRYLALRFGTGDHVDLYKLGLELTQQDFAEMIGSTRETTSVELHKLRRDGLVNYNRAGFIINLNKCSL